MLPVGLASAVVVRVRLPAALERIRRRGDPAASAGLPAHVTLLVPFLPVADLRTGVRRALADIAAAVDPFDVTFRRLDRFPATVFLVPEPGEPFTRLTLAIADRFPDYQPYGGSFKAVIPHLTLTDGTAADDGLAAAGARHLPFARPVRSIEVLSPDGAGSWGLFWRIALGTRQ